MIQESKCIRAIPRRSASTTASTANNETLEQATRTLQQRLMKFPSAPQVPEWKILLAKLFGKYSYGVSSDEFETVITEGYSWRGCYYLTNIRCVKHTPRRKNHVG